jgi:hypothetical protein
MLQPMLGRWSGEIGFPASAASQAARRSLPVTRMPFSGRLSSNWPR